MRQLLLLLATTACTYAADATGTWTGTINIPARTEQEARSVPAHLVLKQEGSQVTGTAGPDGNNQYAIQNGTVENGVLRFDAAAGEALMKFVVRQNGDEIKGEITRETSDGPAEKTIISVTRSARTSSSTSGANEKALAEEMAALDTALFGAYNACDLDKFASLLADDVEFYHDKAGRSNTPSALVDSLKKNICGKVRRELVAGSMHVYPIPGYGAIQEGQHRFSNGGGAFGKAAKFLHVWHNNAGEWKVTRVVSYDH